MAKKSRQARTPSFEERAEDFGEEVSRIGERFGREAEIHGKRFEKKAHSTLGFIWPLISSILGIIVFVIAIWLLGFVAEKTGIGLLPGIRQFLLANLGLFFTLFIVFGYAEYFSKEYRKAYRPLSPIVKALGAAVVVWIVASIIIISGASIELPFIQDIAVYALGKLFWIFAFFAIVGYLVLLVSKQSGKKEMEEVFMAREKSTTSTAPIKRLYRSGKDKILGGVCGGIAEYLRVDPTLIRLLWVVGTLISMGAGILAYIIAWIIIPRNPKHNWN